MDSSRYMHFGHLEPSRGLVVTAVKIIAVCLFLGRGIVYVPEDNSSDCDEEMFDSICRGHGISINTDPQSIKFEVFSTRIHEFQHKQCVVGPLYWILYKGGTVTVGQSFSNICLTISYLTNMKLLCLTALG